MLVLRLGLYTYLSNDNMSNISNSEEFVSAPDNFTWSKNSKQKYEEALSSSIIQKKITDWLAENGNCDIHRMLDRITDVMVSAGDVALLRKSFNSRKRKRYKQNKKWYDKDCHILLKELKSLKNAFNRNIRNNFLRIQFYKKFKEYKNLIKFKKRKYKENIINLLNDAMDKDPQTAWRIIDELKKDSVAVETAEGINRQDWQDHFQKLLDTEANKVNGNRNNFIKEELRYFEDLKHVSSIDYRITEKGNFNSVSKIEK